jgi:hypothetical protein
VELSLALTLRDVVSKVVSPSMPGQLRAAFQRTWGGQPSWGQAISAWDDLLAEPQAQSRPATSAWSAQILQRALMTREHGATPEEVALTARHMAIEADVAPRQILWVAQKARAAAEIADDMELQNRRLLEAHRFMSKAWQPAYLGDTTLHNPLSLGLSMLQLSAAVAMLQPAMADAPRSPEDNIRRDEPQTLSQGQGNGATSSEGTSWNLARAERGYDRPPTYASRATIVSSEDVGAGTSVDGEFSTDKTPFAARFSTGEVASSLQARNRRANAKEIPNDILVQLHGIADEAVRGELTKKGLDPDQLGQRTVTGVYLQELVEAGVCKDGRAHCSYTAPLRRLYAEETENTLPYIVKGKLREQFQLPPIEVLFDNVIFPKLKAHLEAKLNMAWPSHGIDPEAGAMAIYAIRPRSVQDGLGAINLGKISTRDVVIQYIIRKGPNMMFSLSTHGEVGLHKIKTQDPDPNWDWRGAGNEASFIANKATPSEAIKYVVGKYLDEMMPALKKSITEGSLLAVAAEESKQGLEVIPFGIGTIFTAKHALEEGTLDKLIAAGVDILLDVGGVKVKFSNAFFKKAPKAGKKIFNLLASDIGAHRKIISTGKNLGDGVLLVSGARSHAGGENILVLKKGRRHTYCIGLKGGRVKRGGVTSCARFFSRHRGTLRVETVAAGQMSIVQNLPIHTAGLSDCTAILVQAENASGATVSGLFHIMGGNLNAPGYNGFENMGQLLTIAETNRNPKFYVIFGQNNKTPAGKAMVITQEMNGMKPLYEASKKYPFEFAEANQVKANPDRHIELGEHGRFLVGDELTKLMKTIESFKD